MARILVIDDDEVVRMLLTRVLESDGHTVVTAADGRKGVALFSADPPDLVITDIYMPNQEGLATIMELRRNHPGVKIVAISGGGSRASMDILPVAEALGAVLTLRKPLNFPEVREVVQELLTSG